MRIAVCFSGQPRDVEKYYPLFRDNVFQNHEVDVFVHVWENAETSPFPKSNLEPFYANYPTSSAMFDTIRKLYQPKEIVVEKQRLFLRSEIDYDRCIRKWQPHAYVVGGDAAAPMFLHKSFSMFYSLQKSIELCMLHSLQHDVHYDFVIRARFDSAPSVPIDFTKYNKGVLHYPEIQQPAGFICDWFFFSDTEVMGIIGSTFMRLPYYHQTSKEPLSNESIIYRVTKEHAVPTASHKWPVSLR